MLPGPQPLDQDTHKTVITISDPTSEEAARDRENAQKTRFKRMPYADAVIGHEIHNFWGGKVIEHTTPSGAVLALKVKTREGLRFPEADVMHYAATHGIFAPKVYGVYDIESSPRARVMVSDRVPGTPLVEVWGSATEEEKASYKA